MEFKQVTRRAKSRVLDTKKGALIRFADGAIGMVTQNYQQNMSTNDFTVIVLSGGIVGNSRFCMHHYDHERVNVEVVEPIEYMEVL